ncbi:hypothetical protein HPB51_007572 [Rhipicephalus microplus]|uniref:Uncharacterized protein n=1 Tax=Rhipicephalus microplus TaxID=6941 RepID=A0A9J6D4A6_RHIMP|nr:hypothetical protein HPB51_007572 [Rhipicephalus microplus]
MIVNKGGHVTHTSVYVAKVKRLHARWLQMGVLRCRLESKSEALLILTRDLEQCQSERDQFKLMADQLRERHGELRRRLQAWSLAQLLCDLKEQNRRLQAENESLGQKLREALEDAKARIWASFHLLREQVQEQGCSRRLSDPCAQCSAKQDRQELVRQLEVLQSRVSDLAVFCCHGMRFHSQGHA